MRQVASFLCTQERQSACSTLSAGQVLAGLVFRRTVPRAKPALSETWSCNAGQVARFQLLQPAACCCLFCCLAGSSADCFYGLATCRQHICPSRSTPTGSEFAFRASTKRQQSCPPRPASDANKLPLGPEPKGDWSICKDESAQDLKAWELDDSRIYSSVNPVIRWRLPRRHKDNAAVDDLKGR